MTPFRVAAGVVAALVLVTGGLGCAELWHSFVSFGTRSKAGEACVTLERLCRVQLDRMSDGGVPAARYRELGFDVERGNRYAYLVAPGAVLEERIGSSMATTPNGLATGVQVDLPRFGAGSVERRVSEADCPVELAGGVRLGANGECPKCSWVMAAAGNIDVDSDLDVWSVSTAARRTAKGEDLPACQPFHEHDDVEPGPIGRLFR